MLYADPPIQDRNYQAKVMLWDHMGSRCCPRSTCQEWLACTEPEVYLDWHSWVFVAQGTSQDLDLDPDSHHNLVVVWHQNPKLVSVNHRNA